MRAFGSVGARQPFAIDVALLAHAQNRQGWFADDGKALSVYSPMIFTSARLRRRPSNSP
jgi:hypothetical protein